MVISSIRVRKNDSDTDEDLKKGRTAECRPPLFIGITIIYYIIGYYLLRHLDAPMPNL